MHSPEPDQAVDRPVESSPALTSRFGRFWTPTRLVGVAAAVALLLPVLVFGPWLPLIDLVGFVGMYSYPPQLSYGPFHYYVFQFSYVGVMVFSRLCSDLQLAPQAQIPILYLLQTGVCLAVVYGSLKRLVANVWVRAIGISLGAIALWDGVFLWGGPLAHSLGACCLSAATFLAMRDAAEENRNANTGFALLVIGSICFHPFALPFALVLCGVRFLFDPRRRWHTVGVASAVLVFGFIIFRDAPPTEVGTASGGLRLLFGFRPAEIARRVTGLFLQDSAFATTLFGSTPVTSLVVFWFFAVVHVIGFVAAPFFAQAKSRPVWLRMLGALVTCGGVLYFLSCDLPNGPIGEWPQRVLTLYAPFTFLAGFIGLLNLVGRVRPGVLADAAVPRLAWLAPLGVLCFVVLVQAQVFRYGRTLEENIARTRQQILDSGVKNAYVVVSGMDNVRPFYLRAIPFVLFSDRALIAKNIVIGTEWHVKARHPTRVAEGSVDLGRKRYLAEFSSEQSVVSVQLVEQPQNRFPVNERTNQFTWMPPSILANDQLNEGTVFFKAGAYGPAVQHFNTAIYLRPDAAVAWNSAGAGLYNAGQKADALRYFETAIARDPNMADARVNLALTLVELGRAGEAMPHLEHALQVNPSLESARRLLEKLKESR